MNPIVIRSLDESIVYRLKQLAWQKGASLEETVRQLLVEAVTMGSDTEPKAAASRLHLRSGV
jgi:plasmid stability protein